MSAKDSRKLINIITVISTILMILLGIYWYKMGILTDQVKMKEYLSDKQVIGPLIFVFIQIIQVVIPIIPGGVSLVAGVIFFGIGSIIIFFLARFYGKPFILHLVSEETYNKYMKWTVNQKKFNHIFAWCIIAPVAPDDILCMIAGLTEIKVSTYIMIIIFGKPWTILAYSLGLVYGSKWFLKILGK